MGGSGTSVVVAVIAPIVTVVAVAVTIASTIFTRGAIFAVAAAVDCFTPRTDLAPVIAVFAVYTALIMNVVAFAASAGANHAAAAGLISKKPLNMLLEEEMEMWKENTER